MSIIDSQVAMLSQVVAQGSLPLPDTAYTSVWVGELLNGVYLTTLSSPGGVGVGFIITDNGSVSPLLAGQGLASVGVVATVLPSAIAAGGIAVTDAGGGKYNLAVTTGTAGGGATAWRITRVG